MRNGVTFDEVLEVMPNTAEMTVDNVWLLKDMPNTWSPALPEGNHTGGPYYPRETYVVQYDAKAQSAPPVIIQPVVGDTTITGTGIIGERVEVTIPGVENPITAIVDATGKWSADVPADKQLAADDLITAVQTGEGKLPSDPTTKTVLDKIIPAAPDNPDPNRFARITLNSGLNGNFSGSDSATGEIKAYYVLKDGTVSVEAVFVEAGLNPGNAAGITILGDYNFAQWDPAVSGSITSETNYTAKYEAKTKTPNPTINQPIVGDTTITGTGVEGATVTVTVPWSETPIEAPVTDGIWRILVPETSPLEVDDQITALQTMENQLPSDSVTAIVPPTTIPETDPDEAVPENYHRVVFRPGAHGAFADSPAYFIASSESYAGQVHFNVLNGVTFDEVKSVMPKTADMTVEAAWLVKTAPEDWNTEEDGSGNPLPADTHTGAETFARENYYVQYQEKEASTVPTINQPVAGDEAISGTGVIGATVDVTLPDGSVVEDVPVTEDPDKPGTGTWTVPLDAPLAEGETIRASQTESGKTPSDPVRAVVNPQSPLEPSAVPDITQPVVGDTEITGTGVVGARITVTFPDDTTGTATVDTDGTWTVPIPGGTTSLANGDQITATQTETGKGESAPANATVVDKPASEQSAAPSITQPVVGDTSIAGTGVAGSEITVTFPDNTTGTTTVGTDGTWTIDVPGGTALTEWDVIQAVQEEPEKVPSQPARATVVAQAEEGQSTTPTIQQPIAGDTEITGTGVEGAEITVTFPDNTTGTATVGTDGTWTIDVPGGSALIEGDVIQAVQTEPDKEPSHPAIANVIEKPAPAQSATPHIIQPIAGDAHIQGTGVSGASISLTLPGATEPLIALVDSTGNWTVPVPSGVDLQAGDSLTATQTEPEKRPSQPANATVIGAPQVEESASPTIDTPKEADAVITGTGVPGATITVRIPGVDGAVTTTVGGNGRWRADVPEDTDLQPGDHITATQTESNKNPSQPANAIVQGHIIADTTPEDDSDKPAGYVTIRFDSGRHGSLQGVTTYYVNPDAGKTYADLQIPSITPHRGYVVGSPSWSPTFGLRDDIKVDATHTAQYDPRSGSGGHSGGQSDDDDWYEETKPTPKPDPTPTEPSTPVLNTEDHYAYLVGYPNHVFGPDRAMTRAEVATMFTRLLLEQPLADHTFQNHFIDVEADAWYFDTVGYAAQQNIVRGYPDGTFRPNQPVSRAEFAAIASRFAELTSGESRTFTDLSPEHWAYEAVLSAATHGWIAGYPDGTFQPAKDITRAEVTAITNRMLNRQGDRAWLDANPAAFDRYVDVGAWEWFYDDVMEATLGHDFTREEGSTSETWLKLNGKSFI